RNILRGVQQTYRHQTVTGEQVRQYITQQSGIDLSTVFQQYLETTKIPAFEYRATNGKVEYRWADVVPGFAMPIRVTFNGGQFVTVKPTTEWQAAPGNARDASNVRVDENYYVIPRLVTAESKSAATTPKSRSFA